MKNIITVKQIKAARVMLDLKQKDLAVRAGLSVATLNNIERGAQTDPKLSTIQAIRQALESGGIEFINDPLGSIGVKLKPKGFSPDNATILIVDDDRADRTLYRNWLEKSPGKNYRILEASNSKDGFDVFVENRPQCVILDFMMYGADGFQLLASLREKQTDLPPIIFVTGMHNEILEDSAKSQGVHRYLNKRTMNRSDLYHAVETALNL